MTLFDEFTVNGTSTFTDRDGVTGSPTWSYATNNVIFGRPAIRQDGTIFFVEVTPPDPNNGDATSSAVVALDGTTGTPVLRLPLPSGFTQAYDCNGNLIQNTPTGAPNISSLAIDSNGTFAVAISVNTEVQYQSCSPGQYFTSVPFTSSLSLFLVNVDGSTSQTPLHTTAVDLGPIGAGGLPRALPQEVIPDGQGGFLAGWIDYLPRPPLDHVAHVTGSGVSDYTFPALYGHFGSMVLGDNGAAYATDSQTIQAFDLNSGQSLWNYLSPAVGGIDIVAAVSGGGLAAKEFDQINSETILRFDSTGGATADGWSASSNLQYFVGDWYGFPASGSSAMAFFGAPVLWADSVWLTPKQGGTSAAEPDLKLLGQSDCENMSGRDIEYWLVKPDGALETQPYVVFEKQTDHSVASPNGVSPLDYSGEKDKFFDNLRPGAAGESHDSIQTFNFGLQGQRLYQVRRIERKLVNAKVPVVPPQFRIVMKPYAQATLNGQHAPYVGPCYPVYPPN
jgi:hypothetical protein